MKDSTDQQTFFTHLRQSQEKEENRSIFFPKSLFWEKVRKPPLSPLSPLSFKFKCLIFNLLRHSTESIFLLNKYVEYVEKLNGLNTLSTDSQRTNFF